MTAPVKKRSVKKVLTDDEPISSEDYVPGNEVTVDLSTVDASIETGTTSKTITGGTLSNSFPNTSTFTRNGLTIHLLGVTEDT